MKQANEILFICPLVSFITFLELVKKTSIGRGFGELYNICGTSYINVIIQMKTSVIPFYNIKCEYTHTCSSDVLIFR